MLVAVLSDIHANLSALDAVLDDCARCEQVWCLGDVVGYGPDPNACIERIRTVADVCIAGNHDWAAIGRIPTADFNELAAEAAEWTSRKLTAADRQFLEERPTLDVRGDYTMTHGSPRDPIWEYLMSEDQALDNFAYFDTSVCFVGHSHVPIAFSTSASADSDAVVDVEWPDFVIPTPLSNRRHIINVGSVGQPRDGDPRASYVVLDTERRTYQRRRVPYDIGKTQARMRAEGLPAPLWARLARGR